MKKKSKNQVYIPHQDKWNEHFPTPGKPNPNYYTDSGATFKAYNCSELAPGRIVHNFYYELSNRTLTGAQINSILAECPLLFDDGSQPKPAYTAYLGSLYITLIAEA